MGDGDGQAGRAGRIELICGCMFSGKSERLIERIRQARATGIRVAAFKHASDDRYANTQIVTHSGWREPAYPVASPERIAELAGNAAMILIDEVQFFGADLAPTCEQLAEQGCEMVLAGLDRNARGEPFGSMPEIEQLADSVTRVRAVCAKCGKPAEFSQRITPVEDGKMIGGAESYEPRCADCFDPNTIEA